MNRKGAAGLIAVVAAGVAIGACGGDDAESITKAEFTERAGAICERGNREIERDAEMFFGDLKREPSKAKEEQFVTEIALPNVQRQVDGVEALPRPEGDEDTIQSIVDKAQEGIDQGEADPSLLTRQGSETPGLREAAGLARDYGIAGCAE